MDILTTVWETDLYRRLILTVLILAASWIMRKILLWLAANRIPVESPFLYSIRKATGYLINVVAILLLLSVWVIHISDISVALGILAAGLAFALQEIIGSVAGWASILSGRPFTLGDRIETGGIRGDVVDIGILRTTLMEIGNWMHGDHNTGRIVTVSNAYIFKEPLFNYSTRLNYIWDEIDIPITYESDWQRAIEIMTNTVLDNPNYQDLLPKAQEQRRMARRDLAVKITSLEPRVYVNLTDNWVDLGLIYPVDTDTRRSFRSDVNKRLLSEFEREGIVIASQTISIVKFPTDRDPA